MATTPTTKSKPKKKIFRFYGLYNNISIGPKIRLNGVKVILHEQSALTLDEAFELYKLHLMNNCEVLEKDLKQYLIDLYYKVIRVEILDGETVEISEIPLI